MAKRIRAGESGPESAQRIVRVEVKRALKCLTAVSPADTSIHDARKRLKRARAALRLIREPLGDRRFRRENESLRDAARPLSEVRDAKILVESLDILANGATISVRGALRRVRERLVANQLRVRRRVLGGKQALKPAVEALLSTRKRAQGWPSGGRGWSGPGAGVRRVYRAGRKAFASALSDPSDERLHEWRKQTKYLWHQLEMLEPVAPRQIRAWARDAHQLSDHLGDDHDLAVLRDHLRRAHAHPIRKDARAVSMLIDHRRRRLRASAMALGERVYARRPRLFSKVLEHHWRAWRRRQRTST
jgi:CHAD domain-containing protein